VVSGELTDMPKLRERAAGVLLEFAQKGTPEQQANAMEGLLPLPARLEASVRANLSSPNQGVRSVAALVAGRGKLKRLTEHVRGLVGDQSALVRASAIYALQRMDVPVDPTPLSEMLADGPMHVRAHAAFILGELRNASAVPMLLEASGSPAVMADAVRDRLMRLQVAEALIKLGKTEALSEVRAALYPARPEDLEACALAAQILGQVRDEASRPNLRSLLREQYDAGQPMPIEVRLAAAASLARMDSLASPRDVQATELALGHLGAENPAHRAQAAMVLGESGQARFLGELARMLEDQQPLVRIAAGAAILKITEASARGK
jgi:HEAT repeat protein